MLLKSAYSVVELHIILNLILQKIVFDTVFNLQNLHFTTGF
jgi:hypothetical protein